MLLISGTNAVITGFEDKLEEHFNLVDLILYNIRNHKQDDNFNKTLEQYKGILKTFNILQLNEILVESILNGVDKTFIDEVVKCGANKNILNIELTGKREFKKIFPDNFFRKTNYGCSRDRVLLKFLLKELDNPNLKLKNVIHITGSNGKGSTVTFLRYILEANGYSVNCFTNPSVMRHNENFVIRGKEIDNDYYNELMLKIKEAYDKVILKDDYKLEVEDANDYDLNVVGKNVATNGYAGVNIWVFWSVLFCMAFLENEADYNIVEVRNGGIRDVTNVFTENETIATILTYIQYGIGSNDGVLWMINENGEKENSNRATAYNKAMLGKKNVPMIVANQTDDVLEEIRRIAKNEVKTETFEYDRDWFVEKETKRDFVFRCYNKEIVINKNKVLFEDFQTKNIATALATLCRLNVKLDDELTQRGIDVDIYSGFIKFNDDGVKDTINIINENNKYSYVVYTSNSKKILRKDIDFFKKLSVLNEDTFKLIIYFKNNRYFDYITGQAQKYNIDYEVKMSLSSALECVKEQITDKENSKILILNDTMSSFDKNIVLINSL